MRASKRFDAAAFAPGAPTADGTAYLEKLAAVAAGSAKSHSGMWRDIAVHHHQSEAAALILPICELGDQIGAPARMLRAMIAMIVEIERGYRPQSDENYHLLLEQLT